jgi:hypothetical protein
LLIVGLIDDHMLKISVNWGGQRGSTATVERSINLRTLPSHLVIIMYILGISIKESLIISLVW